MQNFGRARTLTNEAFRFSFKYGTYRVSYHITIQGLLFHAMEIEGNKYCFFKAKRHRMLLSNF